LESPEQIPFRGRISSFKSPEDVEIRQTLILFQEISDHSDIVDGDGDAFFASAGFTDGTTGHPLVTFNCRQCSLLIVVDQTCKILAGFGLKGLP